MTVDDVAVVVGQDADEVQPAAYVANDVDDEDGEDAVESSAGFVDRTGLDTGLAFYSLEILAVLVQLLEVEASQMVFLLLFGHQMAVFVENLAFHHSTVDSGMF